MSNPDLGKPIAMHQRLVAKLLNTLMGIVNGIVCDGCLSDTEIRFLSTWMQENEHIANVYPAN